MLRIGRRSSRWGLGRFQEHVSTISAINENFEEDFYFYFYFILFYFIFFIAYYDMISERESFWAKKLLFLFYGFLVCFKLLNRFVTAFRNSHWVTTIITFTRIYLERFKNNDLKLIILLWDFIYAPLWYDDNSNHFKLIYILKNHKHNKSTNIPICQFIFKRKPHRL